MTDGIYDRSAIDIDALFKDPDTKLPADPDEVHIHWKEPDGTVETRQYGQPGAPAIAKLSTGHYRVTVDLAGKPGFWECLSYGVGTIQVSRKRRFLVQALEF